MDEILLNQKQVDALIQHSEKAGLAESCAMLLGTHNDQQWNVKEVLLTRNAHNDSETSFIIAPEELLQGHQLAEKKQLELVGIFHSQMQSACTTHRVAEKIDSIGINIEIVFCDLQDIKDILFAQLTEIPGTKESAAGAVRSIPAGAVKPLSGKNYVSVLFSVRYKILIPDYL